MKRFYTLVLFTVLTVMAFGQHAGLQDEVARAPKAASSYELENSRIAGEQVLATQRGGDEFFCEDFANGFDGNNPFGAWTFEDTGGNSIWMMADGASPAGDFSTGIAALASPSAANGWVIFDCDLYNSPFDPDTYEDVTGYLYSPEMDMSEMNSVIVDYYQYFRYCCFPGSPLTLEVSNDGGLNWAKFPAHGDFIEAANTISANPLNTKVDVSCAAAGFDAVQIRWGYNDFGSLYSHYFWGIDDVCIYENPSTNDLHTQQVTNGDVFTWWEYRVTPLDQAIPEGDGEALGGLIIGTMFQNLGSADQMNVVVTSEVLDDDMNVLATIATEPFDIPANANSDVCPSQLSDTVYQETGWAPPATGMYYVRTTVTSDNAEETEDDNVMMKEILYTDEEWGHDWENDWDVELRPRESDDQTPGVPAYEPTGYGNRIHIVNDGVTAYGLTAAFGGQSDAGCEFAAILFKGTGTGNEIYDPNSAEPVTFMYDIYENGWDDQVIFFPFDDPVEMFEDEVYFFAIFEEFGSDQEITVLANNNTDTDFSTLIYEVAGDGSFIWFSSQPPTPAVRLITTEWTGTPEVDEANGITLEQNIPNPAPYNTVIYYSLEQTTDVAFEVRDITGKLVYSVDNGTLPAGSHQLNIVTGDLAPGVYNYTLIANNDVRITKKMMVAGY
jgi:hypothetical protein